MRHWSNIVWALLATLAMASSAFAQGGGASSTGSISGEVKDGQGGVLPGVTVTATSPAQIGSLTAVTNEAGLYRFPAVPPGEYRLAYELAGFQASVRDGIRITLGFNAQVNVTLNVATLQETVTVSGESPVIDTSATRIQTNYDQQMLSSIPNARDMWSLLSTTPSVTLNRMDVGGSTAGTQTTYFAYGYSGQNRPLIEGINTTEGTSAAGFYLDYGSFEEVFIGAAGGQLPGRHAVQHQAVQLHRQGHVSVEPGQQVHRLPAARHEGAAQPHRRQPRGLAGAHHGRVNRAPGVAELGRQG